MTAHWYPFTVASIEASTASIVLPDPTSPCTRRRMERSEHISLLISSHTRLCAPVSLYGSFSMTLSHSAILIMSKSFDACSLCPLSIRIPRMKVRNSSSTRLFLAFLRVSSSLGKCMSYTSLLYFPLRYSNDFLTVEVTARFVSPLVSG